MDKGEELNVRVWTLFENAGFQTEPNSVDRSERKLLLPGGVEKSIDLSASDHTLRVTIVGSNKTGPKIDRFSDHIAGLIDVKEAANANCALLVATEKEFSDTERRFLRRKKVELWGERELSYFESLVNAIGHYAKYEIIHTLGIATDEQTTKITVPALMVNQPSWTSRSKVQLFMFSLQAEFLLKVSAVLRKARTNAFMYQRILTAKRLPRIGEFLNSAKALLPTSIVLHMSDSITIEHAAKEIVYARGGKIGFWEKDPHLVALTIPSEYASLEIIDGQHRLFGFVHGRPKTRRDFRVIVVGVRNLSPNERSKTFVAINDKAKRVDPSLVSFLRYTENERRCQESPDLMAIKIAVELNKRPPFKNAIRLWDTGPQKITLKGISGYDLKGMVGDKGVLRHYYPHSSAAYIGVLRQYFSVLQDVFEKEWNDPKTYIIATNRGVSAFLKLLKSIHKNEKQRIDEAIARKYFVIVRNKWIKGTWESAKLDTSYSASQGWKQFHRDLIRTIQLQMKTFRE